AGTSTSARQTTGARRGIGRRPLRTALGRARVPAAQVVRAGARALADPADAGHPAADRLRAAAAAGAHRRIHRRVRATTARPRVESGPGSFREIRNAPIRVSGSGAVVLVDQLGLLGLFRRFPLLLLQVGLGAEQPGSPLLQEVVGGGHLHRLRHTALDITEVGDLAHGSFGHSFRDVFRVPDELGQRVEGVAVLLRGLPGPGHAGLAVGSIQQFGDLVELASDVLLPSFDGSVEPGRAWTTVDLLVLLLVVEADALRDLVEVAAVRRFDQHRAASDYCRPYAYG